MVSFGSRVVQRSLNFSIRQGSIFAIMGGSGCGKSTVLKAMVGLLRPATGAVVVDGEDYWAAAEERRAEIGRRFGVLFQSGALWSSMTVAENVALPLQMFTHLGPDEIAGLVDLKLSLVGLAAAANRMPSELSGGMRKRAGLARALALDPGILFFDEPSAGLDPITSQRLDDLILELSKGFGATVVLVSHDLPSLFAICDDGVFLDAETKTAVAHGAPRALRDSCDHPAVRAFMERGHLNSAPIKGKFVMRARPAMVGGFILGALGLGVAAILFFGGCGCSPARPAPSYFLMNWSPGSMSGHRNFPRCAHRFGSEHRHPFLDRHDDGADPGFPRNPTGGNHLGGEQLSSSTSDYDRLVAAGVFVPSWPCKVWLPANCGSTSISGPTCQHHWSAPSAACRRFRPCRRSSGDCATNCPICRCATWPMRRSKPSFRSRGCRITWIGELDPLADSAQRTSDVATKTLATADEAVRHMQADASTALHDLDVLLVDTRRQLDLRSDDLGRTLTASQRTVGKAELLLEALNGMADPRSQFRGDLEAAVHDLAAGASSLRSFGQTVERNPNALLMGRAGR